MTAVASTAAADAARRALALLDLTDLSDGCTPTAIDALCARAVTPHGSVAAVCLYPRFVAQAKAALAGTGVRVATVVNFPAGGEDIPGTLAETRAALADGADDIDLVLPWRAFLSQRAGYAETMVMRVREAIGGRAILKVILETGEIADAARIRDAADLAIAAGADFIKTSTGKVTVNATLDAAEIMLQAIRASGRPVGFKPAGGVKTAEDAAAYLALAGRIMGPDWAMPATFRFGASGLLDALVARIEGRDGSTPAAAY
ncbi:deoxyribose-phosphate aldolase [Methylobrevis sp. L22]|uniref:Deoxyribose-phosphate aldolase n=1 Tax=Methylobrevis albus TaxID=2793297 RepID=A0A931MX79_9HYPH|nr:deoxyribose-phosphate aldolase [Methylobrevis albus]MBH0238598.1 deoxyribose-phosphate aldolase [Methylobrevis albus]